MSEIKVRFLKNDYLFPKEVREYVQYCQKFIKISDNFLDILNNRIKNKWYNYPDIEFEELFKEAGKAVVKYLSQDGIYDVTISELVENNSGYILFQNITEQSFEEYKNIFVESTEKYIRSLENTQAIANSKVTGSGVTLYSNSLIAHLTFSALESSTIKKQMAEADKEYSEAMTKFTRENQSEQDKKQNDFLYNKLYPAYFEIIGTFINNLIEKYLKILDVNSVYDYSKAQKYDTQKSTELLNNIDLVDDKKQVLVQAFKNCPYNNKVYKAVVELGLMDMNTYKTACIFGQKQEVIDYLKEYCISNIKSKVILKRYISIIAYAEKTEENVVWDSLYANEVNKLIDYYQDMKNALNNNYYCKQWINKYVGDDEELIVAREEVVSQKVLTALEGIEKDKLESFIEYGLITYEQISMENSEADSVDMVNSEYYSMLVNRVESYIELLKNDIKQREQQRAIEIEKQKDEERIKNKKRTKIFVIAIVICTILVVLIQTSIQSYKENELKEIETYKEKIEKGSEILGQNTDAEGGISVSQEFLAFIHDVEMFGYEGSINHGMTNITEETIDIMDWVSNEECNDQDLEEVLSKLIKIYGDYSKIEDSNYADMDKSYQWMNVDGYEWVICGLTSEGKILIRWMI